MYKYIYIERERENTMHSEMAATSASSHPRAPATEASASRRRFSDARSTTDAKPCQRDRV